VRYVFRMNAQRFSIVYVMQSRTTTVINSYSKTSVFISHYCRCSFFVPSCRSLFHTFISERDCTILQCFYKGCIQSNQQLTLGRLVHRMHCGSAIFPYQALERRTAQETLIGRGRLHYIKNSLALNIYPAY
jgi:hypothetical protein